ncbi:MAG: trans-aconitate 2-methyltransferase [Alphaproteobacteria bacterium]|nr:trans-aconitate 2-methyltransferase [Alphaproteobacteria bacterium]MDE2266988.1 trans-aconitate 2-methyltransferase [Alphaproteobacteria bacterium]MDE2499555.1 trans-aconitate 2-methyltransferase [Alphaproteobacteria bacterium]
MAWDPGTYLSFEAERTRPAAELLARIPNESPPYVVDLGCGPGNSTALLAARWPQARIEGVDSSPDMLTEARGSGVRADWSEADIVSWTPPQTPEVIFSNAAFQWLGEHERLLPRLMSLLPKGGTLAFQVPRNFDDPSHTLIREVAGDGPWAAKLRNIRSSWSVLAPEDYFSILEPHAARIDIWQTRYMQVLDGPDAVYRWTSGTGLRPFSAALADDEREAFLCEYRQRVAKAYPVRASGKTLFPFRRLFVVAWR